MQQNILQPGIHDYITQLTLAGEDPLARKMEKYGDERNFPYVGPLVGRFLFLIASAINAKRIFECGSGYGYSAYWFAKAVGKEGRVICTEGDQKNCAIAQEFLETAKLWNRIAYHCGKAQDIFEKAEGQFDIVYNDADKDQYPEIFELVAPRIRKGGFYICDNVLWSGLVVTGKEKEKYPGWTKAIQVHNELVFAHPEFDTSIIPLRDGVIIARRKE